MTTKPHLFGRGLDRSLTGSAGQSSSLSFNLAEEVETLRLLDEWTSGSGRKTLVRYPDFRIDLVAIKGGTTIARHSNPGRIAVQCVSGLIRMHTDGGDFDLPEGEVLVLDHGVGHDVEAIHDSAFLLTISLPNADVPAIYNSGRWVLPSAHVSEGLPAAQGQ